MRTFITGIMGSAAELAIAFKSYIGKFRFPCIYMADKAADKIPLRLRRYSAV